MSLFEHLEELRQRIFYALIAAEHDRLLCCSQADCPDAGSSSSGRQVSPAGPGEYFLFPSKLQAIAACSSPVPLCFMRLFSLFYQD